MNPHIFRQVDRQTWIAVLCLIVGWFFTATLVTTLGPVKQKYHFFDMLTVMLNPSWLIYGMGSSHVGDSILFGVLCTAALVGPIVPFIVKKRSAWLLCLAPLLLMLLVGFELYERTSGPYFEATQRAGSIARALVRWGNSIAVGTGNMVARHISVGFGSYLSLAASIFLTVKGLRTFRSGAPVDLAMAPEPLAVVPDPPSATPSQST